MEYPDLEGTHKDHWVQLLAPRKIIVQHIPHLIILSSPEDA